MASIDLVSLESGGYCPLQTAAQYTAREMRELVNVLYGGDAIAFLSDYIKGAEPEERAALELAVGRSVSIASSTNLYQYDCFALQAGILI